MSNTDDVFRLERRATAGAARSRHLCHTVAYLVETTRPATGETPEVIRDLLESLQAEFDQPDHGLRLRTVAKGYQFTTKPEHHDGLKRLQAGLRPPLPLSKQAVETAAVIAMLQPASEVQAARKVRNNNAIRTLLRRKLIAPAGRAHTRGNPVRYRTTEQFLMEFGLNDLSELPTVKEFRHIPQPRGEST